MLYKLNKFLWQQIGLNLHLKLFLEVKSLSGNLNFFNACRPIEFVSFYSKLINKIFLDIIRKAKLGNRKIPQNFMLNLTI